MGQFIGLEEVAGALALAMTLIGFSARDDDQARRFSIYGLAGWLGYEVVCLDPVGAMGIVIALVAIGLALAHRDRLAQILFGAHVTAGLVVAWQMGALAGVPFLALGASAIGLGFLSGTALTMALTAGEMTMLFLALDRGWNGAVLVHLACMAALLWRAAMQSFRYA